MEEFKISVYGENYDEEEEKATHSKASNASKKRKQVTEEAINKCEYYDWGKLADDGKVIFAFCVQGCFNYVKKFNFMSYLAVFRIVC